MQCTCGRSRLLAVGCRLNFDLVRLCQKEESLINKFWTKGLRRHYAVRDYTLKGLSVHVWGRN